MALKNLSGQRLLVMTQDDFGIPQFRITNHRLQLQPSETHGVLLNQTVHGLVVSEGGGPQPFSVALTSQPSGNVTLRVTTSSPNELHVSPQTVTFTPENWNVPQAIYVRGLENDIADDDQNVLIRVAADAAVSDPDFASASAMTVATILDNDGQYAGILPIVRIGDTAWLFSRSSAEVQRFDSQQGTWLAPVVLSGRIGHLTAAYVDESGTYAAYGEVVYRFDPDGSNRTQLFRASNTVTDIQRDGRFLFVFTSGLVTSLNAADGTVISSSNQFFPVFSAQLVPGLRRILGVNHPGTGNRVHRQIKCARGVDGRHGDMKDVVVNGCFTAKRFEKLAGGKQSATTGYVAKNCLSTLIRVPDWRFWHPFRIGMRGTTLSLPVVRLSATTG